jgi:hypothetical protein
LTRDTVVRFWVARFTATFTTVADFPIGTGSRLGTRLFRCKSVEAKLAVSGRFAFEAIVWTFNACGGSLVLSELAFALSIF